MEYIVIILIIISEYYTVTYGITLYKKHKNKLGGLAALFLALSSAIISIVLVFIKLR